MDDRTLPPVSLTLTQIRERLADPTFVDPEVTATRWRPEIEGDPDLLAQHRRRVTLRMLAVEAYEWQKAAFRDTFAASPDYPTAMLTHKASEEWIVYREVRAAEDAHEAAFPEPRFAPPALGYYPSLWEGDEDDSDSDGYPTDEE